MWQVSVASLCKVDTSWCKLVTLDLSAPQIPLQSCPCQVQLLLTALSNKDTASNQDLQVENSFAFLSKRYFYLSQSRKPVYSIRYSVFVFHIFPGTANKITWDHQTTCCLEKMNLCGRNIPEFLFIEPLDTKHVIWIKQEFPAGKMALDNWDLTHTAYLQKII